MICYHRMFWVVNLIVFAKKLYRMMMTLETMIILALKMTETVGLILIGTWTPVMIKVTA